MRTSEQIDQLALALAMAQAEFTPLKKNKINPHFKSSYADLDSDIESTRPALTKHGLAVVQGVGNRESEIRITTRLIHKSGQWLEDDFFVRPERDGPQGRKSAATYGRRTAYEGIVGIAPEDDDGEAAENRGENKKPVEQKKHYQADVIPLIYAGDPKQKADLFKIFQDLGIQEPAEMKRLEAKIIGKSMHDIKSILIKETAQ